MADEFKTVPLEVAPDELAQDAFDYLGEQIPGWEPTPGDLLTIAIESESALLSELFEVATDVPAAIFRHLGAKLHNLPPVEASAATVSSTWTMVDDTGYTIPEGTQVAIPTPEGDRLGFETVAEVAVGAGDTVTAVGEVVLRAIEEGSAGSGLSGTPELVDGLAYVESIALVGVTTGGVDAESDSDYLDRLSQTFETLAPRPIIPRDFAIMARSVASVARATAIDLYNPEHNLLTLNQASLETDTTGWSAQTNCSIIRSTAESDDGAASLRLSSTAGGTMSAVTPEGASGQPVVPHDEYTAIASFRAAASVRSCIVSIEWYDAGGSFISNSNSVGVPDTTTGFTQTSVTESAPGTAAFAAVAVTVLSTGGASELHYADKIAFRRGAETTWAPGDTPAEDNERTITVALADAAGGAVSGAVKTAVDDLLQAERELNFLVYVIDPTYTVVDVSFTADAYEGFLAADVEAQAEAAVADYLDPANWGQPRFEAGAGAGVWINETKVRMYELVGVLENVEGLNHVNSLQIAIDGDSLGSVDVDLAGIAPLPQPGTIAGTVT